MDINKELQRQTETITAAIQDLFPDTTTNPPLANAMQNPINSRTSFGEWLEESWNNQDCTRGEMLEAQFEKQTKYNCLEAYINAEWAWHLEVEHRACENGVDI